MSEETRLIMEQLKLMNGTMMEMKEDINILKNNSEINNMKMDYLLRSQTSIRQDMYDILMLRANEVGLRLKMIDLESGIRRIESRIKRIENRG